MRSVINALRYLAVLFILLPTLVLAAQAPRHRPQPCSSRPEFQQFDFWVGNWQVFTPTHQKDADATVSRILKGCGLAETWTSAHSSDGDGRGLSTYNPVTKNWEYFWVAANGYTSLSIGRRQGDAMSFRDEVLDQAQLGAKKLFRFSMTSLTDGRIKEQETFSVDGGKTWKEQYVLYWERKK